MEDAVNEPTMIASNSIDLVQDVTADCSVVASLCAAVARTDHGFEKVGLINFPVQETLADYSQAHEFNYLSL
jgi:hypothetical protein